MATKDSEDWEIVNKDSLVRNVVQQGIKAKQEVIKRQANEKKRMDANLKAKLKQRKEKPMALEGEVKSRAHHVTTCSTQVGDSLPMGLDPDALSDEADNNNISKDTAMDKSLQQAEDLAKKEEEARQAKAQLELEKKAYEEKLKMELEEKTKKDIEEAHAQFKLQEEAKEAERKKEKEEHNLILEEKGQELHRLAEENKKLEQKLQKHNENVKKSSTNTAIDLAPVSDSIMMNKGLMELMLREGPLEEVKTKWPEVKLEKCEDHLGLSGKSSMVKEAKLYLFSKLSSVHQRSANFDTIDALDILEGDEARDHINGLFYNQNLNVTWEVLHSEVKIYGFNKDGVQKAKEIVGQLIQKVSIPVEFRRMESLRNPDFHKLVTGLQKENSGLLGSLKIDPIKETIQVIGIGTPVSRIVRSLEEFLGATVDERCLTTPSGAVRILKSHHSERLKEIETELKVKLSPAQLGRNWVFKIKGSQKHTEETERRLAELMKGLPHAQHVVSLPGMANFFQSGAGESLLDRMEMKYQVAIDVSVRDVDQAQTAIPQRSQTKEQQAALNQEEHPLKDFFKPIYKPFELLTLNGLKIFLFADDITRMQADCIVNNAGSNMGLNHGPLSKNVLAKAGVALQEECYRMKPSNGVKAGQIIVTSGQQLPCKFILHTTTDKWDKVVRNPHEIIHEITRNALKEAANRQCSCIAFPALGSNSMKLPPDVVVRAFLQSIVEMDLTEGFGSIKQVYFCLERDDNDAIKAFSKEFELLSGTQVKPTSQSSLPHNLAHQVTVLDIYSFTREFLADMVTDLDSQLEENFETYKIDGYYERDMGRTIKKLTPEQVKKVEEIAHMHCISVRVDQSGRDWGDIQLEGWVNSMIYVVEEIRAYLKHPQQFSNKVCTDMQVVTWQYQVGTGYQNYPKQINSIIEEAYQKQSPQSQWNEKSGNSQMQQYKVDFSTMTEMTVGSLKSPIIVRRTVEYKQ